MACDENDPKCQNRTQKSNSYPKTIISGPKCVQSIRQSSSLAHSSSASSERKSTSGRSEGTKAPKSNATQCRRPCDALPAATVSDSSHPSTLPTVPIGNVKLALQRAQQFRETHPKANEKSHHVEPFRIGSHDDSISGSND